MLKITTCRKNLKKQIKLEIYMVHRVGTKIANYFLEIKNKEEIMMKKYIAIVLMVMMTLVSGCTGNDNNSGGLLSNSGLVSDSDVSNSPDFFLQDISENTPNYATTTKTVKYKTCTLRGKIILKRSGSISDWGSSAQARDCTVNVKYNGKIIASTKVTFTNKYGGPLGFLANSNISGNYSITCDVPLNETIYVEANATIVPTNETLHKSQTNSASKIGKLNYIASKIIWLVGVDTITINFK